MRDDPPQLATPTQGVQAARRLLDNEEDAALVAARHKVLTLLGNLRKAVAAADAETLRTAKKASARLAKKMRQQLRRAERARARTAVEVYPTQAARRLSRRSSPDKLVQELCAWIEAPPLSKMSTPCEDEDNSVQLDSNDEFSKLIVSDLVAATTAFFAGVSGLNATLDATATAFLPAPAAPVSRPGQTATTALENCSLVNKCTSACCANSAPVPALARAPTRSAGRRLTLDAPIAIAVSPIAEVVECFMAGDVTYDHRRFVCEPFNDDLMTWLQFDQDFGIGMLVKYTKDDNEYNLAQTLKGTDIGGRNNTVPLALHANLDPAVRQERTQHARWHERRNQTLYTFVVNHVADPNLCQMLINEKPDDGVGAWEMLGAHVYREPDDFALSELETQYSHMNYVTCGSTRRSRRSLISSRRSTPST